MVFGGLFGGDDIEAPKLVMRRIDQFGAGLEDQIKQQGSLFTERMQQQSTQIPQIEELVDNIGLFPTLNNVEQDYLRETEGTFRQSLAAVQANNLNATSRSLQGLSAAFGLSGIPLEGAGAQSLAAGIASRNQTSANEQAMALGQQMNQARDNLINFAMTRQLNQLNARTGLQSGLFAQGQQGFTNLFNASTAERSYKSSIDQANAQMQFAADTANAQNKASFGKSLFSGGISLLSGFLGG